LWTPPHFWSLALYRAEDYRKAGLPMLPITHGNAFTRLHVLLYTVVLLAASLLPYIDGMSGVPYLVAALVLGGLFCAYAWRLWRRLALPDLDGRMRTLDDFKGKVTVLFFGYTQCPDVCPTTLAELEQVKKTLGADGDKLQGVFVTIDPERDTPDVLRQYVASFD